MTQPQGALDLGLFKSDPCRFIQNAIEEYARTSPLNHLVTFDGAPIFDEPVVAFAGGDDPLFQNLKTIIGEFHLTPREALEKHIESKGWRFGLQGGVEDVSVISWALPIPSGTRLAESAAPYGGSARYNHTRWTGANFLNSMTNYVTTLLEILGRNAVSPTRSRFYEDKEMPGGWRAANWSERHVAYACGLGTFGLNGLVITSRGCAAYLGSVVCDIALTPTPRNPNRVGNCLFYKDGSCRQCLERCTASAISEEGRANIKCLQNLRQGQAEKIRSLGLDKDLIGPAPACGRCSTGVPCSDRIPSHASAQAA